MKTEEKIQIRDCSQTDPGNRYGRLFHTIGTMINRGLSISFEKGFLKDGIVISMNRKNVFTRTVISNDHLSAPCIDSIIRNELFNMENKIIEEENKYE